MNLEINKKYLPLFKEDSRYFIVTGGRGSSKSFTVTVFLLNLTYEEGHKILFTRYTLVSASASIIPEFIEKIDLMGLQKDFRITKDEIVNLKTGSAIMFKGIRTSSGNQTAALKSLAGVTTFVVDEAEELASEDDYTKVDLSVRSKHKQNRVILILNPTTKEHFIYRKYFLDKGVEAGWNGTKGAVTYIHTTFKDNEKHLPADYINQLYEIKRTNISKYEHVVLGGWLEKAEGVIIRNWKTGDFVQTEAMCYGQDYGFSNDPTTLIKVAVDKKARKIYVKEIYGKPNMSTSQIAFANLKECGNDLVICDNSEPRLTKELKNSGVNMKPTIKKVGSILSGIALLQDYQIVVHPTSSGIIREFNNYVWHEKGVKPIDKWNHYVDGIRYAVQFLLQGKATGRYAVR